MSATERAREGRRAELLSILANMLDEYNEVVEHHQWPIEMMRWNELIFSIVEYYSSASVARAAARALSLLDLLDVRRLAELAEDKLTPEAQARGTLVIGMLKEAGCAEDAARRALKAIVGVARVVDAEFDGKVQRLLRREGERIATAVSVALRLPGAAASRPPEIAVRWLQNALGLPILLETAATQEFCKHYGITMGELVDAADTLDLNVSLLDELLDGWYKDFTGQRDVMRELSGNEAPA